MPIADLNKNLGEFGFYCILDRWKSHHVRSSHPTRISSAFTPVGGTIMADLVSMGHVFIIERLRAAEDWCDQIFENFFFGNSLICGPNYSKDSIHEKQNMICIKWNNNVWNISNGPLHNSLGGHSHMILYIICMKMGNRIPIGRPWGLLYSHVVQHIKISW